MIQNKKDVFGGLNTAKKNDQKIVSKYKTDIDNSSTNNNQHLRNLIEQITKELNLKSDKIDLDSLTAYISMKIDESVSLQTEKTSTPSKVQSKMS